MNMLMIRKQRHLLFEWQRDSLVVLSTTTSSGGSKRWCNPAMPPSRTVCQWDLARPAGKEFYMSCRVLGNNYVVHIMPRITKSVVTRSVIRSRYGKQCIDYRGSVPDFAGGAYSAPSDPLVGLRGRGGREKKERRGWEERGGEEWAEKRQRSH